jgi:sugar phosphate isomerase/epimerase
MLEASVWSSYFIELPPEEAINAFLSCGFFSSELSDEHGKMLLDRGNPEKEGARLKRFADERGFDFPQGHLLLRADICAENAVEVLKPWLDLFCAAGIKAGVLHAAGGADLTAEKRFERRTETLRKLCEYIDGSSLTICLENLRGETTPQNAFELNELIDAAGGKNLGICLDTGHLNLISRDSPRYQTQGDFIRVAGERLMALHIADNDTTSDMHLMPFGRGNIDWKDVMSSLKECGYNRLFNLEIPGERLAPMPVKLMKLHFVRQMCSFML